MNPSERLNPQLSDGPERLMELLAARAAEGLTPAQEAEIEQLLAQHPEVDPAMFDSAAAAAYLEPRPGLDEPMPTSLRQRIESASAPFFGPSVSVATRRKSFWERTAPLAWLAAAAAIVLAVLGWWQRLPEPSAAQRRASLVSSDPAARVLAWAPTGDPAGKGISGDVIWSESRKQGYMRFKGLAANDPSRQQYQLWIFDKNLADPEQPVDGGVFDIPAGADEVVIPITPKLALVGPQAFAVTIERPGGVVVSKREHLIALAK